jgi:hypothetical protein
MSFWRMRTRRSTTPYVTIPGYARLPHVPGGLALTEAANVQLGGFYQFHMGDVFTGGASAWALDPSHDTQLMTWWGNGVMRNPYAFRPTSEQVIVAPIKLTTNIPRGMIYQGIAPARLQAIQGESFNG